MRLPSLKVTSIRLAPCTTWLLVSAKPSAVNTTPEPLAAGPGRPSGRAACRCSTAGDTASAAAMTAREYASSRSVSGGAARPLEAIRVGFGVIQNELEIAIETHERHPNQQNHPRRFMKEARGQ